MRRRQQCRQQPGRNGNGRGRMGGGTQGEERKKVAVGNGARCHCRHSLNLAQGCASFPCLAKPQSRLVPLSGPITLCWLPPVLMALSLPCWQSFTSKASPSLAGHEGLDSNCGWIASHSLSEGVASMIHVRASEMQGPKQPHWLYQPCACPGFSHAM